MEDPRAQERVGSVLHDKWTLERLIGMGGVGAVYAARHRNGARAAIKVLSPLSARQPGIRDRFLREGYAANRVEHPGAVKVLDDDVIASGPDEGTPYLVMELLEGESLQDRASREPPLNEREILEIADGVLAVLEAAHAHGVVHRDLKPDNLFITRDPDRETLQVKVLDFGLARLSEKGDGTFHGRAVGTPTYMSPEQAAGQTDLIDGRTDIYALGSMMFQLVSNKRIHDAQHTLGLVVRMATTPAPKLKTAAPDVSDAFAAIVDRALAFKRDDRYPSAADMRRDVKAAHGALQSLAPSPVVSHAPPPPEAKSASAITPPTNVKSGWTLAIVSALLVAGITLIVVTARLATSSSTTMTSATTSASGAGMNSASVIDEADASVDGGDDEDDEDDDDAGGGGLDASSTYALSVLPPPAVPAASGAPSPHAGKQPLRKRPPRRGPRRRRRWR